MSGHTGNINSIAVSWQDQGGNVGRREGRQKIRHFEEPSSSPADRTSTAAKDLIKGWSMASSTQYPSTRELLRKNIKLLVLELASFSVFTLCWW